MRYVEAPAYYDGPEPNKVFIAGGISCCGNWQQQLCERLDACPNISGTILNPRRSSYEDSAEEARSQIKWEFVHLRIADAISFWFPAESNCPITLFELGKWLMGTKPLFIGTHPSYPRRLDIETQVKLERPGLSICYSLDELANRIGNWCAWVQTEKVREQIVANSGETA